MNFNLKAALLSACVAIPAFPVVSHAENGLSGAYLAGRQASFYSEFDEGADWYTEAMRLDPGNPVLQENALTSFVGLGDIGAASELARDMRAAGINSQVATIVTIADLGRRGEFEDLLQQYEGEFSVGPLIDGLVLAWAQVGAGQMSAALEGFDAVASDSGTRAFGLYHKALALALVGDFNGADEIFAGKADGPLQATVHGVLTHASVLSQLERNEDALELLATVFGSSTDPIVTDMRETLTAGRRLPLSVVSSPSEGLSEVFFSIAGLLENEASESYTILYSRAAEFLNENNVPALLLTASLLENLEQYDLATKAYDQVPRSHPSFHEAEIGRAEALRRSGNEEAAVEVLTQLAESRFDLPVVHNALGDTLRAMERFDEASQAYDRAIALFGEPGPGQWVAYYARGITHEREDRWDKAEADFRYALELSPGQPYVLNYLGYSLVEHRIKLDEALTMIEEAVAARPDDGFITDSLGWVLYRLGNYQDAVVQMERAAALEPVDPIVNDHLGDVLWAVGRTREAEFQWRRAMSFEPEEKDAERIRRKLEVGLDVVLEEEGAEPLAVAEHDDNGG